MKSLMTFILITILVGVLSMGCEKEVIKEIVGPTEYDTTMMYDTTIICEPFVQFAFAALQHYGNVEILTFINSEFGYTDGWIYYLTITQSDLQSPSPGVYDIYGYANYWTMDFDAFYPLEYFWRITYLGGDPSASDNWELSNPPNETLSTNKVSGIRIATDRMLKQ